MSYDSPDRVIEREHFVSEAGGAATTVYGKNRSYADRLLNKVKATVAVAGTAAGHAFELIIGTATVATIALSTSTAGVEVDTPVALDVPAGALVAVKSKADTVGKADFVYQFTQTSD